MIYFVVAPDGQKYGPADLATLNQWIHQGRILQNTVLEDASSGLQSPAAQVAGLQFGLATTPSGPSQPMNASPYQQYPRQGMGSMDDGSQDISRAWIYAILGFFCCPLIAAGGIYHASLAERKGNLKARKVLIVSILSLISGFLFCGVMQTLMSAMSSFS